MTSDDSARIAAKAAADAEKTLRVVGGTAGLKRLALQADIAFTASKFMTPELRDTIAKLTRTSELSIVTQALAASVMPKLDVSLLMPKFDFSFNDKLQVDLSPGYRRLAEQIAAWLPRITLPTFPTITVPQFLPPNLRGIKFDFDLLTTLANEGITVYRVPGRVVSERLLRAKDKAARRAVLGRALPQILGDCDAELDSCVSERTREPLLYTRAAIAAARAGHLEAAQALLTNTLDTTLGLLPDRGAATRQDPKVRAALDDKDVSTFLVLAPIWHAHGRYFPERGDLIPRVYSRHASTHGVSRRQYGPRNTAQAVLLLTSLIAFLDEGAA